MELAVIIAFLCVAAVLWILWAIIHKIQGSLSHAKKLFGKDEHEDYWR